MQAAMKPMSCSKLEEKMISPNGYWGEIGMIKEGREWHEKCAYTTVISKPKMFPASTVNLTSL